MQPNDQQVIDQIASQVLGGGAPAPGGAPAAPADPAAAMQGGAAPQQPPKPPPAPTTQTEAATANTDPADPGDTPPVEYEIELDGGVKRKLTPKQIAGMMSRYTKLNHDHATKVAPMKPVLEFAEQIMSQLHQSGQNVSAEDLVKYLHTAAQAYAKSPIMGKGAQPQGNAAVIASNPQMETNGHIPPHGTDDGDDPLAAWERDNAATLPPGYRDQFQKLGSIEQQMKQLMQLLPQIVQGQRGVAGAANEMMTQGVQAQQSAAKQTIVTNLQRAQQQLQLPDEAEQDFMRFAFERGYTFEDFLDPQLTMSVASDFRNHMQSPEFQRMRDVHNRRQAYTGNVQGAPASGAAPAPNPDADFINSVANNFFAQRGGAR